MTGNPVRRALLVGIDDYRVDPLVGCVDDANGLGNLLRVNDDGSPNFSCRVLTAPSEPITRAALMAALNELFANDADVALFFFAGHGTETNLGGYLVTQDASSYNEGISLTELLTLANNSRAKEVVVLLDSCRSGSFGALPALGTETANLREGVSVLTAARSYQDAVGDTQGGVFTLLIRAALEGGAADVLGEVTVASVYSYLDQSLGPWDQRPLMKSHVSTLIPLRRSLPALPLEVLRRLPDWFGAPDAEFPLDPSYEPEAEPEDSVHEEIFGCLQKCRAAKLVEPVGEEHMYFAAVNSKACRLTPLGRHYLELANRGLI
jgi:hypothetical protein